MAIPNHINSFDDPTRGPTRQEVEIQEESERLEAAQGIIESSVKAFAQLLTSRLAELDVAPAPVTSPSEWMEGKTPPEILAEYLTDNCLDFFEMPDPERFA